MKREDRFTRYFFFLLPFALLLSLAYVRQGNLVPGNRGDLLEILYDGNGDCMRLFGVDCSESSRGHELSAGVLAPGIVFEESRNLHRPDENPTGFGLLRMGPPPGQLHPERPSTRRRVP